MVIGIDFDGTCVTHDFPRIGRDIGAVPVLKDLVGKGHKLVLNTMRSNKNGKFLDEAVEWFQDNGIPLYGVNRNPTQGSWTSSPKVEASLYIDDCGAMIPLIRPRGARPYVDWESLKLWLTKEGIL